MSVGSSSPWAVPLNEALPQTVAMIEEGIARRLHRGAQVYVSRQDRVIADDAIGEACSGERLTREHLMLLLSAGKPLTAVAVAQLWERGLLALDEFVAAYLPEFASGGKERITIRHLLTHTGGFRNADAGWSGLRWDETIQHICKASSEPNWIPGLRAGYHRSSSWFILGEVIRRLDGRPFEVYLREAICEPLGLNDLWNGLPIDRVKEYDTRLSPVFISENGGDLRLWEIGEPDLATTCIPGSNTRGTARELGRFYEALLRDGRSHSIGPNLKTLPTESPESQDHPTKNLSDKPRRLLKPETVAELIRPQRVGLFDETFQHVIDFGLGVVLNSNRYGSGTVPYGFGPVASDKAFGHGGSQSSIAFADPERDLVVVVICNGRPGEGRHQRRMRQILEALEEDLQNTDGELFFG